MGESVNVRGLMTEHAALAGRLSETRSLQQQIRDMELELARIKAAHPPGDVSGVCSCFESPRLSGFRGVDLGTLAVVGCRISWSRRWGYTCWLGRRGTDWPGAMSRQREYRRIVGFRSRTDPSA